MDFVTGVNNDTYKAYIDFAAAHQLEYCLLYTSWRGYYLSNRPDYLDFGADKEKTNGGRGYVTAVSYTHLIIHGIKYLTELL